MDFKLKTCEEEYSKDDKIKREDIKELMEWMRQQPHLPEVKGNGKFIYFSLNFLIQKSYLKF